MGRTRDTYGGDERCTQGYDEDLRERDMLEDVEIKNGGWTGLIWLSVGTSGGPL
jgi:hypothetical protein